MGKTIALIVAAGQGSRMGGSPKQYRQLAGRPMIAHSYLALSAHPAIDDVLVVIGASQEDHLASALGNVAYVIGGEDRRRSVRNGLEHIAHRGDASRVLIHDAARPFVPVKVIESLVAMLDESTAAIPMLPVADTLARSITDGWVSGSTGVLGDTVPRTNLNRIQTPQAFHLDAILAAHRAWPADEEATDDAQMLRRAGHDVMLVPGDPMLEKITHPADFAAAEARHAATLISPNLVSRCAMGFDVHRLETGQELWLGGIRIPHDKGLSGHSDADVALHAITDALLGTIGAGDIGMYFPPSDPKWRGAASGQFLQHAAGLVTARGGIIDFVDLTLICEAPKIGPHRDAIRTSIAALLALPPSRISVKATTTERLGFTGRGEGMAAQAVATVRIPE